MITIREFTTTILERCKPYLSNIHSSNPKQTRLYKWCTGCFTLAFSDIETENVVWFYLEKATNLNILLKGCHVYGKLKKNAHFQIYIVIFIKPIFLNNRFSAKTTLFFSKKFVHEHFLRSLKFLLSSDFRMLTRNCDTNLTVQKWI